MKESNYNTQQQFEDLVKQGRELSVPEVNVRANVRAALERQVDSSLSLDDVSDTLMKWFSGIRGGVFASALVLTVLLTGIFVVSQTSSLLESGSEEDGVSEFMDSGDWSQWL